MALSASLARLARVLRKPPGYVIRRSLREARMEGDRLLGPLAARRVTGERLARQAGAASLGDLWERLRQRPYPLAGGNFDAEDFSARFPEAREAILAAAERAVSREVDLLGCGPVELGRPIDWLGDLKTGDRWQPAFCRSIDYVNRGRPSDVKRPWELSRLQWLLPAGQAFRLTGDERYAQAARDIVDEWISANPHAWTVNWSCTMEPALRILSWTALFHFLAGSQSWADEGFRGRFLSALYMHGSFVETHIERASINGNHLTADAAGMVFAGLFFEGIGAAGRWAAAGWRELEREIGLQVHPDGVDFEASVPYHRLVAELFLLAARYRQVRGLDVSSAYAGRMKAMAAFTAAYSRPDGTSPVWGDADDGRAVPLGTQALGDHRYLVGLVALAFDDEALSARSWGAGDEIAWHFGPAAPSRRQPERAPASAAFREGGVYILQNARNHVFVDCGPVGLAGLGGHGHNDALSFEAWLDGTALIVDPGAYVYTSSFEERNAFRSTAAHNTIQVDDAEINRFHSPDNLWNLHEDARAECLVFRTSKEETEFVGLHHGYQRLAEPAIVRRSLRLDHATGALDMRDEVSGPGRHRLSLPLHLSPDVSVTEDGGDAVTLAAGGKRFRLEWSGSSGWELSVEPARVSPSYGVAIPSSRLVWRREGSTPCDLRIRISASEDGRPGAAGDAPAAEEGSAAG